MVSKIIESVLLIQLRELVSGFPPTFVAIACVKLHGMSVIVWDLVSVLVPCSKPIQLELDLVDKLLKFLLSFLNTLKIAVVHQKLKKVVLM